MLILNDTALSDNQAIWVIRIDTDTPICLSTAVDKITLSGIDYDGKVILKDSLSDGGKTIDFSYGGGIGSVGSFEFSIARYNLNSLTDGFFNEFYPTIESGPVVMPYLIARAVSVGIVWEGATTEAEITWLFYGYIDDYSYDSDKITLSCLEYAELENVELPYYKVQKDFDNGISYFPEAPEENIGKSIPIVYGDLSQSESLLPYVDKFLPVVRVGENKFVISSHKNYNSYVGSVDDRLFEYISEYDLMLGLTEYNYVHREGITYAENTSSPLRIDGKLFIYPHTMSKSDSTITGELKDITTLEDISHQTTYVEIPNAKYITLKFKNADNILGQIGSFSDADPTTSAYLYLIDQGESASSTYKCDFVHPDGAHFVSLPVATQTPGTAKGGNLISVLIGSGFSFKRFMESSIIITNTTGSAEWIRVYDIYFAITGTVKTGIQTKAIYGNVEHYTAITRNIAFMPLPFLTTFHKGSGRKLLSYSQSDIAWDGNNLFATGFGRMF